MYYISILGLKLSFFFQSRWIFERWLSFNYITKQLRRNSLQLQSFDSFCCPSRLQWWQCARGITLFNIASSIAHKGIKLINILFRLFLICSAAFSEGRRYSRDYHLRRIEPFNHRNDFNHNHVFPFHVSKHRLVS